MIPGKILLNFSTRRTNIIPGIIRTMSCDIIWPLKESTWKKPNKMVWAIAAMTNPYLLRRMPYRKPLNMVSSLKGPKITNKNPSIEIGSNNTFNKLLLIEKPLKADTFQVGNNFNMIV